MSAKVWKVGRLARETGLSIRTLHYYDEIGLLSPSGRTESGHRLYTPSDVARLQRIVSLRLLGFALDAIRECLEDGGLSSSRVIALQIARLDEQLTAQKRLRDRLEAIAKSLDAAEVVSTDTLIQIIQEMNTVEKYYTKEQLDGLAARRAAVGEDRIREVEAEWPALMAEVGAEMARGTDPKAPHVRELARRWMSLVSEFTGGDTGMAASVKRMWNEETNIHGMDTGPVREMMAYIQKSLESDTEGSV